MKQVAKDLDSFLGSGLMNTLRRKKFHGDKEADFMDVMLSTSSSKDAEMFGFTCETIIKTTTLVRK
ncbi:cytochrome P450 [Artemisia annua]|uniref:Cytochrome P450 n=1 Tax=Artemisia annua TaxID=35608 RepID=A0A2U1KNT6_ARTAN|nr:cytochrome P450 [Artemisia annua]